jgi:hypothetical protein
MSKFILVRWKDGYQEVGSLEEEASGRLRYYVIERVEKYGRLAVDGEGEYPGLKVIRRKPDQVESITFVEDNKGEKFILNPHKDKSEGGRVDHHYEVQAVKGEEIDGLVSEVRRIARELSVDPKTATEGDIEKIRKGMKLSCLEEQSEVLNFVKMLVEKCA